MAIKLNVHLDFPAEELAGFMTQEIAKAEKELSSLFFSRHEEYCKAYGQVEGMRNLFEAFIEYANSFGDN